MGFNSAFKGLIYSLNSTQYLYWLSQRGRYVFLLKSSDYMFFEGNINIKTLFEISDVYSHIIMTEVVLKNYYVLMESPWQKYGKRNTEITNQLCIYIDASLQIWTLKQYISTLIKMKLFTIRMCWDRVRLQSINRLR